MSVVSLLGVKILNNPAKFSDPYHFEITFECLEQLQKDLEWKLTYVGSATSSEHDQELDSLLVGPIPVGVSKFIFEADPPDLRRIPATEILGVTVILLTCSYDNREFVRVGYYVNNEYDSEELNAEPPAKPDIDRVRRNVLAEKPRVTRFAIKWDTEDSAPAEYPPDQPEADILPDDSGAYGAEEIEMEEQLKAELVAAEEAAAAAETTTTETEAQPATNTAAKTNGDSRVEEEEEDSEMAGADDTAGPSSTARRGKSRNTNKATSGPSGAPAAGDEEDEDSDDAGSEDLEAESSGSDDEDEEGEEGKGEEGEGEGEADGEDMEMADGEEQQQHGQAQGQGQGQSKGQGQVQQQAEVMVH